MDRSAWQNNFGWGEFSFVTLLIGYRKHCRMNRATSQLVTTAVATRTAHGRGGVREGGLWELGGKREEEGAAQRAWYVVRVKVLGCFASCGWV